MKNRKLLLVVSLMLALTMSLGGTLAYLTDTDEAVNVMTLGNVQIEQIELQRAEGIGHTGTLVEGNLVSFEQGQPLYPAYPAQDGAYTAEPTELLYWGPYVTAEGAGNGLWDDDKLVGAMDKFVFVKNTGTSDAYYRTWFAFECPEGIEFSAGADKQLMMNVNGSALFDWETAGYVTIDDVRYLVRVATYQKALAAGEISRPSLLQVVLTHNADGEDMEKLGGTYEILAYTQAVQTKNMEEIGAEAALNEAFGAVITTDADEKLVVNHPWKDADGNDQVNGLPVTVVDTADELKTALENGGTIALAAGTYDLNGETINLENDTSIIGTDGVVLTNGLVTVADEKSASFENVKFTGAATIQAKADGALTFKNCVFEIAPKKYSGFGRAAAIIGANQYYTLDLIIDGCTFNYKNEGADPYNAAVFMWSSVDECKITNSTFNGYGFVAVKLMNVAEGANIVFDGNTFNMSQRGAANYWYNSAIQLVPQHNKAMTVSITNNAFNGDYQMASDLVGEFGFSANDTTSIVAEVAGMNYSFTLSNVDVTVSGNTLNGEAMTEANVAVKRAD